eukprot:scaffold99_cov382-Prasinococcus_capsulatus_cf.AAC.2
MWVPRVGTTADLQAKRNSSSCVSLAYPKLASSLVAYSSNSFRDNVNEYASAWPSGPSWTCPVLRTRASQTAKRPLQACAKGEVRPEWTLTVAGRKRTIGSRSHIRTLCACLGRHPRNWKTLRNEAGV